MKQIILSLFVSIIIILLYLLFSGNENQNLGTTSLEVRDKGGHVTQKVDISFAFPTSKIFSSIAVMRPANVPLTPFTSPLKTNYPLPDFDGIPPFLLYKKNFLFPVIDQGNCGSCWAFSIAFMLSDRTAIVTGGEWKNMLSAQQIMQCYQPEEACVGNSPETALQWMMDTNFKLNTEQKYPYKQITNVNVPTNCPMSDGLTVREGSVESIAEFIEEEDYDEELLKKNIENMKLELLNNGPFFAAMSVYKDFYSYNGKGVYQHEEGSELVGGHAIEIIGYCEPGVDKRKALEGVEGGYWICRNSWGSLWPTSGSNSGFFIIAMGKNESGIESRCGVAETSVSEKIIGGVGVKGYMRYNSFDNFVQENGQDAFV